MCYQMCLASSKKLFINKNLRHAPVQDYRNMMRYLYFAVARRFAALK